LCDLKFDFDSIPQGKLVTHIKKRAGKSRISTEIALEAAYDNVHAWIDESSIECEAKDKVVELIIKFEGQGYTEVDIFKTFGRTVHKYYYSLDLVDGVLERVIKLPISKKDMENCQLSKEHLMILLKCNKQEIFYRLPIYVT